MLVFDCGCSLCHSCNPRSVNISLPSDANECEMFGSEICRNGQCSNLFSTYTCYCRSGFYYDNIRLECVGKRLHLFQVLAHNTNIHITITGVFCEDCIQDQNVSLLKISNSVERSFQFLCVCVCKCVFRLWWVWVWNRLWERRVYEHSRLFQLFLQSSISPGQHTAALHQPQHHRRWILFETGLQSLVVVTFVLHVWIK